MKYCLSALVFTIFLCTTTVHTQTQKQPTTNVWFNLQTSKIQPTAPNEFKVVSIFSGLWIAPTHGNDSWWYMRTLIWQTEPLY